MQAQPVPLIVLGGYLGAGKTTIVNALLAAPHGLQVTVLVNDFGAVNVDATLIRRASADVIGLENGCICCSIGGKLMETLADIAQRPERPDVLIVEASGVSDPSRIAQVGLLDPAFVLCGVLVAVDATDVARGIDDRYVGEIVRRQLTSATVVVMTKTDSVCPETADAARQRVREFARTDILIDADHGRLPPELFSIQAMASVRAWAPRTGAQLSMPMPMGSGSRSALPAGLTSWTYRSTKRLHRQAVKAACVAFSRKILRAKGIVAFADGDADIHLVGDRWKVTRHSSRADPAAGTAALAETILVFIGMLDQAEQQALAERLDAAVVTMQSQ